MTKNYYKNEYIKGQWEVLVDEAMSIGCKLTYSKYGNILEVDTTEVENRLITHSGRGEKDRYFWACHIHDQLQESATTQKTVWAV